MDNDYIVLESEVLSTDDKYGAKRIKVRLGGIDRYTENDADLPYCFPLMPKLMHIYPKVGEKVLVIMQESGGGDSNRFYIGPVLSQAQYFLKELASTTASNMLNGRLTQPLPIPTTDPDNEGTLPDYEDIALVGRLNTDLILKESEVRLRCGFKSDPKGTKENRLHFNKIDPAYIQMKYKKMKMNDGSEVNSIINVVADRINLLSRDSSTPFKLTDPKELITDDQQKNIDDNAHQLIYGDELINWLKQLVEVFRTHEHKWANRTPTLTEPETKILNTNLEDMLSKAVRIN